jgi:cytochrome P450
MNDEAEHQETFMTADPQPTTSRKIDRGELGPGCPVRVHEDGTWYIRDFATARAVLRSTDTRQAGFAMADATRVSRTFRMRMPVLYRDGAEHREDRRQTSKYFTPRRVDTAYRALMERVADEQCETLRKHGSADLSRLALILSVAVVGEVLGLTEAGRGMTKRLERFFATRGELSWRRPQALVKELIVNVNMLLFYRRDVLPSIAVRREQSRDDVISHLIGDGCRNLDILAECVTFAAAGMVTTREFITLATWHLLSDDALRRAFQDGSEEERHAILREILRLEPVVSDLFRHTTADIEVGCVDGPRTIPAGTRLDISLAAANLDEAAVGDAPETICPHRVSGVGVGVGELDAGLSFGDGAHRCPGSHVALLETNVFLTKLLALPGIRLATTPRIRHRPEISSYELSGLRLVVD